MTRLWREWARDASTRRSHCARVADGNMGLLSSPSELPPRLVVCDVFIAGDEAWIRSSSCGPPDPTSRPLAIPGGDAGLGPIILRAKHSARKACCEAFTAARLLAAVDSALAPPYRRRSTDRVSFLFRWPHHQRGHAVTRLVPYSNAIPFGHGRQLHAPIAASGNSARRPCTRPRPPAACWR